jgi:hypothetical protein
MLTRIIIISAACSFSMVCSAQDDSTHVQPLKPEPVPTVDPQPQIPPPDTYRNTNPLIRIRLEAIPSALRKTLGDSRYRGWERSELYQDSKTLDYSIDIRNGDSIRTFRFDRFGNALKSAGGGERKE